MSYTCSNCFQTGRHESSVGESGSDYSLLKNYYNNYNNQPITLPWIWPQPPSPWEQRPYNAPDYFQNYTKPYRNQQVAYPLPPGCNQNLNFTDLNPWTREEVIKLKLNIKEEKVQQLVDCLNCNHVYKYDKLKVNALLNNFLN